MRVAFLVVMVSSTFLLAGCSSPPDVPSPVLPGASSSGTPVDPLAQPVAEAVPFSFDGALGTVVHGCVFPAGVCQTQTVAAESSDLFIERPGSNLTRLVFNVTWTASTPATATLAIGAMVMADCDDCNSTDFGVVQGVSPLRIDLDVGMVPLTEHARVHVYAYNPTGFVFNPAVPGYAVVSVQQAYHIEGTAKLLR